MKKNIFIVVMIFALLLGSTEIYGQGNPPHPNGGNDPNGGNEPVGGRAPVGSGMLVLLALGSVYGVVRWYKAKRKSLLD